MTLKSSIIDKLVDTYDDIVARCRIESGFESDSNAAYMNALRNAWVLPAENDAERTAKTEALVRILPCEEEAYAQICRASDLTSLIEAVASDKDESAEILRAVGRELDVLCKAFRFLTERSGLSWWYR